MCNYHAWASSVIGFLGKSVSEKGSGLTAMNCPFEMSYFFHPCLKLKLRGKYDICNICIILINCLGLK